MASTHKTRRASFGDNSTMLGLLGGTVLANRWSRMNSDKHHQGVLGACLAVVESGAEPSSEAMYDGVLEASARALIVQQSDETPAELALRATRRALGIMRTGAPLEAGVIVASDATNDEMFLSRCHIARAMIRAMRGAMAPRLVFVAPSTISDDGRHELLSMAGTLATQLHGTPIEVSVRFAENRQISGVHRAVAEDAPGAKPFAATVEVA